MQGYRYSTDRRLPERDLHDLADLLAMQLHNLLGARVYRLPRADVVELIESYINDLTSEDQRTVGWMVWHLFQEAREMELNG
ncbi:MAG: hypothetical protein HC822_04440 [Oscillochloris sp.]|nr:hypothetical protein [Oscillochloris sp.]